jgi:phosphatidylglycerophosphate synthase
MTAGRYNTPGQTPAQRARRDAAVTVLAGVLLACAVAALLAQGFAAPTAVAVTAAVLGPLPAGLCSVAVLRRHPLATTPADRVTLARAVLVTGCAAATVMVVAGSVPARTWWLLALAAPALLLDAVDGVVARRTGSASADGARLDWQLDAGALVVLSLAVAPALGAWVLLIGGMRYAFVVAGRLRPQLRGALAFSQFRRVVAGVQGATLAVAIAPIVPLAVASAAVLVALVLLSVSFGRDVVALERHVRPVRPVRASAMPLGAQPVGRS